MPLSLQRQWVLPSQWIKNHPWIIPLIVILLIYWRLPLTYFEQDEWQAFETSIRDTGKPITACFTVQRPLTCLLNTIEWEVFGTNASAYGLLSLVLIIAISLVFYRLLQKLKLTPYKAVVAASIFPLLVAGSQAITWFGAFSATLPSFLFALLALDFLVRDIETPSWKWRIASFVSVLISLYFKEETIWLFPVFIALWVTHSRQIGKKLSFASFITHLGINIASIAVFLFFERIRQKTGTSFAGLISTTDPNLYAQDLVKTVFLLPLHHLIHIILPPEYTIGFSQFLGITVKEFSAYGSSLLLLYFAGILVIGKSKLELRKQKGSHYTIYLFFKETKERPLIFLFVIWALTSFSAYAVFGKNPEFLEGRYYFATQAPIVALLVLGLLPKKIPSLQAFNTIGTAILLLIVLLNVILLNIRLTRSVDIASERRNILNFIQKKTGPLPRKAIIYTETSNYGYAGQAAAILPFQNGLGTTLRVLYQGKNQNYREVAKKQDYLWNLLNQGYDEVNEVGFGYFREYDKLFETVNEKNLPSESVFAFRYEGEDISDITSLIRAKLEISQKGLVTLPRIGWVVTSNDPGVDTVHGIDKVTDDDPKSDWAVDHREGKYIEVDLGRPVDDVAAIQLITADGNSYPRRFRLDSSVDGQTWQTEYTDIGTIVDKVITPIIFKPKTVRKLKVTLTEKKRRIFLWSVGDISIQTITR